MDLMEILKYVWQGNQGRQAPYLTPGFNGQENPASVIMQRQQQQGGVPPQQPPQPPPVQQQAGGLKSLLQNPNFLQGIAQIAMSQGDYGGARGAGFQNAMAQQQEMRQRQAETAEKIRQYNEEIGLRRSELESQNKLRDYQISQAEANKQQQAKDDEAASLKSKSERFNKAEDNLRQALQLIDPENPEAAQVAEQEADWQAQQLGLDEAQAKRLKTRASSLVRVMKSGKKTIEKSYQDVEISDGKGGHRSALFDPKEGAYVDPETKKVITGAKRYYQPSASIQIANGQDPNIYADMLERGSVKPSEIPQAIRGKALQIAKDRGVEILSDTEREKLTNYKKIQPVLSSISELSEKINVGKGLAAKAVGAVERAQARMNLDDDVAEYQALIQGFTPLVARAVGHVGVLTEQDVASVRELFPKPGDSKTLRDRKIARLEKIMGGVQEATREATIGSIKTNQEAKGPKPGDIQDGYKFKGGNPADQNNWEKVK